MVQSFYRMISALAPRAGLRSRSAAASQQSDRDAVMTLALVNGRLLRDSGWVENQIVLIDSARIQQIVARDSDWSADTTYDLQGQTLLPGFIDMQVNGGGGVLFNDDPERRGDSPRSAPRTARFGTTGFLPTLISDDLDVVSRAPTPRSRCGDRSRACRACWASTSRADSSIAHRRGVHDATRSALARRGCVRAALPRCKRGGTLVTLAPETHDAGDHRASWPTRGVIVSAGHTNAHATLKCAPRLDQRADAASRTCSTRCRRSRSREPGAVGAALDDDGQLVRHHRRRPPRPSGR